MNDVTRASDVDIASQHGRTLDLFDWAGVTPTGSFNVVSPYSWDLSLLYTTGDVTLIARPGDASYDGKIDFADLAILAQHYNLTTGQTWETGDFTGDGAVTFNDLAVLAQNYGFGRSPVAGASPAFSADWAQAASLVPAPGTAAALLVAAAAGCMRRRRPWHQSSSPAAALLN